MLEFAPDRVGSFLDRRLARYGRAPLQPHAPRGHRDRRRRLVVSRARVARAFRVPGLPAANDFIGVNYYSRVHIRFRARPGAVGEFIYRDPESRGLTDMGWEIHPARLRPGPAAGGGGGPADHRHGERHRHARRPAAARRSSGTTSWSSRTGGARRAPGSTATSTGRCSTTSSGWRDFARASASSRSTTRRWRRRRHPSADLFARLGRAPHVGSGWRTFRRRLQSDELDDAAGAGERQRPVVAPSDLGRGVRVRGKRDRDSRRDDAREQSRASG